jgi:anion-transporting  ArsA/GET3 family ATPase
VKDAVLDGVLDGAEVVVCCGSGGVGKTTTAAVIGLEAARRGRRAVVVTIDPARRLADALGLPDGLAAEPQSIGLGEGPGELWAMMLDTAAAFDDVVRRNAIDDEQAERILANTFYRNISGALSGTQEYMAAETLNLLHSDERFDLVVVDTPPSRNALDFLEAPGVLARFLDHRLFRLLMLPARRGMRVVTAATQPLLRATGKVVGSDVLADAVAFFQAFAGMETGFRDRADAVIGLLRSDITRYVVVASPHRDTVTEAVWFAGKLAEQGIDTVAGVANRVPPTFGSGSAKQAASAAAAAAKAGRDDEAALWTNLAELRALADAAADELAPLAELLGPLADVPLLPGDVHDLDGLGELRRHMFSTP